MPKPPTTALEQAVLRLQRSAVLNIFDELGLWSVPASVWIFTDDAPDVADALEGYFRALGLDPARIRSSAADEIERANGLLELLIDVSGAFSGLEREIADQVMGRLFSGDYDSVRMAARAVASMEKLAGVGDRWPHDRRLAILNAYLDQVAKGLVDPLSLSEGDVESAEAAAAHLVPRMIRFADELDRYEHTVNALHHAWPREWATEPKAETLQDQASMFEALAQLLCTNRDLTASEVDEALHELASIREILLVLLAEAQAFSGADPGTKPGDGSARRRSRSKGGAGSSSKDSSGSSGKGSDAYKAGPTTEERAARLFGLPNPPRPTNKEFKKAFTKFMLQHHPDFAPIGDETEAARRTAICQEANRYRTDIGF